MDITTTQLCIAENFYSTDTKLPHLEFLLFEEGNLT